VRIEWSPGAVSTASRFLEDTKGMAEVVAVIDALESDPYPADVSGGVRCCGCGLDRTG